jgi:hypothetical protein
MSPYITCTGFSTKSLDRYLPQWAIDFGSVPSQSETPGKSGKCLAKLVISLHKTYCRESMPNPIDVLIV